MYPSLPYPGYSWSMNHHMGVVNERNLQAVVWAANAFRQNHDPGYDINNYLIANNIFTKNVRADSGQPDTWRDYQQILSELGLLISTRRQRQITLTSIGLAFIENTISYHELITLQALRYQYPNGHKTTISPALRQRLNGTPYQDIRTLTELQFSIGVLVRPAVLVWRVLRGLQQAKANPVLSIEEVQKFLVPCINHNDTEQVINTIISARQTKTIDINLKPSRDIQEWFRFLLITPLFSTGLGSGTSITISDFGIQTASEIDDICLNLENPETFWVPDFSPQSNNLIWYAEYGSIDLSINVVSNQEDILNTEISDFDEEREFSGTEIQDINLRPFNPDNLFQDEQSTDSDRLSKSQVTYDKSLSTSQYILHDKMIKLIADICTQNGGQVFDDPRSLDLFVDFQSYEFLIEVKSVNPRTFVKRLRLALGQLLHYDYLRSLESQVPRRKVVALAARVPSNSWCIPFLNSYLDYDLLALGTKGLEVNSNFDLSRRLFRDTNPQTSLFEELL